MSSLCVFLNTRVENSGALAWIGDKGLAPFRYFFNGQTIRIENHETNKPIEIHRVASFDKSSWNTSKTKRDLESSQTGWIKTALSLVFLIPGLILGTAFKGCAYIFSDVRKNHSLAKEHFTPVNRQIGSFSNPITSRAELNKALSLDHKLNLKNQPTNALIIHGDGNLTINEDPGILQFNPMKLILVGAKIVREPTSSLGGRLADEMRNLKKWDISTIRLDESTLYNAIKDAIQATEPRRSWTSCKRYHALFVLARPQN